ncbi:Small glutamine-rich tetratricopeptide repeat-containing protein 2 [Coemansia sp. RSA 455]|nr:Small glutamine-rich tetratricopeptide repeat-containing protein 2 [Coemansia sp. RSA 455]
MQAQEETRKRLAMAVVEYLDKVVADGSVAGDGAESLEVAKQCISDAFGINLEDETQIKELSLKPFSLDKVFDVYLSTQAKLSSSGADTGASSTAVPATTGPSDDDRKRADEFKAKGNSLVVTRDYQGAIEAYTKAIDLVSDNAVYFGNRAAAYSQNGDYQEAVDDAKQALDIDPGYTKGYSRLGLAYFGMGNYEDAKAAYEKGLELDPASQAMRNALETAQAKIELASSKNTDRSSAPTTSNAASAAAAAPGAGGGFDFASLMSNPALMNMAQSMMSNGGLERLMSNPAISQLANNYRSTGQMPSMADMMSNPDIMDMARNAGGSSADSGAAGSDGANPLASLLNNPDLASMAQQFMRGNQDNNSAPK